MTGSQTLQLSKITLLLLVVPCIVVALLFLYAMVIAPYTPSGKKGICRHELSWIRGILLGGETQNGMNFLMMVDEDKMQSPTLKRRMSEFCLQFSANKGKQIFRSKMIDGEAMIVDPWGNAYNIDNFEALDSSLRVDILKKVLAIGNFVVWSSGPNGVDEKGGGDDVFAVKPGVHEAEKE